MTSVQTESLPELLSLADSISNETLGSFGELSEQQLNWKPGEEQWSVAECFDHLVTANKAYFPTFAKVLSGEKNNNFWERLPWLPSVWGKLVLKAVAPQTTRKRKNPKIFNPSNSKVDEGIIRIFVGQQNDLLRYMEATQDMDLQKITISSPVSNLITYSLLDAYRIIVNHEKRHLLQALRVLETNGFPKGVSEH
jgi:hypothetical protein